MAGMQLPTLLGTKTPEAANDAIPETVVAEAPVAEEPVAEA